jgi:hypothetical protein
MRTVGSRKDYGGLSKEPKMKTMAAEAESASREQVEEEIEAFRQLVITARTSAKVEGPARKSQQRLNEMFQADPKLFTPEDIRWLNVLSGYLGVRLEDHKPKQEHTRKTKRKGDAFDHCWRCDTPVDERFGATCATCSSKAFMWMLCPVCNACGCQRNGKVLI